MYCNPLRTYQFIISKEGFLLILAELFNLHFISATSAILMHFHTAFAANVISLLKKPDRHQFLHAIMLVDHYTACGSKIA